jgi:hypothetical protein
METLPFAELGELPSNQVNRSGSLPIDTELIVFLGDHFSWVITKAE